MSQLASRGSQDTPGTKGRPYSDLLGIKVVTLEKGFARLRLLVRPKLCNSQGFIHGGAVSSLVDSSSGAALHASYDDEDGDVVGHTTAELNVSYLAPIRGGSEVFAEARVLRIGRTLAVVDVDVTDERGATVAKGRATYLIRRRRPDTD